MKSAMDGYSACIEMLFADQPGDFARRIGLAQQAGFKAVEFWLWSNKDLAALEAVLRQTGVKVLGFVAEPMISLVDPASHDRFLAALPDSIAVAQRLGAPFLYIQAGRAVSGVARQVQAQALTDCLKRAADVLQGSDVTLLLEPVSDAAGGYLERAADGLPIIAAVDRPEVRLLYDLYHAAMAGEPVAATIGPDIHLIGHVHVADHPGRGAPGTGSLDLAGDMAWLRAQGYTGWFGMEHRP